MLKLCAFKVQKIRVDFEHVKIIFEKIYTKSNDNPF